MPGSDGKGESRRAWGPRREAYSRWVAKEGARDESEMVVAMASGYEERELRAVQLGHEHNPANVKAEEWSQRWGETLPSTKPHFV